MPNKENYDYPQLRSLLHGDEAEAKLRYTR
jgi:hypothetical protein